MRQAFGALTALRLVDVGSVRKPRVAAILTAAHGLSVEHDEAARTAADTRFHQTIAAASGNQLFLQIELISIPGLGDRAGPCGSLALTSTVAN